MRRLSDDITIPKYDFIYLIALGFYSAAQMLQTTYLYNELAIADSEILYVLQGMRYLAYLTCSVKIVARESTTEKRIFAAGLICFVGLISAVTGTDKTALFILLLVVGAYDVDFRSILKLIFALQVLLMFFCLVSCFVFGLGSEPVLNDGRWRAYLGFGWVNRAPYYWLFLLLEFTCIMKGKLHPIMGAIAAAVAVVLYKFTVTRFALAITLASVFILLASHPLLRFEELPSIKKRKHGYVQRGIFILFALVSILLPIVYNGSNSVMAGVNRLLNSRLSLGNRAIHQYHLGLFGNDTVWTGASTLIWGLSGSNQYNYVDSGFLQAALDYGLIFLLLVLVLYDLSIRNAVELEDNSVIVCLLIVGFVCALEPRLIDFTMNPFIFYGVSTLKRSSKISRPGRVEVRINETI